MAAKARGPNRQSREGKPKYKYLLPLDDEMAERIKLVSKPYPQKCATSETSDTPGVHPGEGRAARTVALQPLTSDSFIQLHNLVCSR